MLFLTLTAAMPGRAMALRGLALLILLLILLAVLVLDVDAATAQQVGSWRWQPSMVGRAV